MPDIPFAPSADAPSAGGDVYPPAPEREYDANGHYAIGPRLAKPPLVRMIADAMLPVTIAAREKAPSAERRRLGREASRATRMRRLLAGQFAPARRKDAA